MSFCIVLTSFCAWAIETDGAKLYNKSVCIIDQKKNADIFSQNRRILYEKTNFGIITAMVLCLIMLPATALAAPNENDYYTDVLIP